MLTAALQNDLDNQFTEYGWLKQLPKNNNDQRQRYRQGVDEISLEPKSDGGVSVVVPIGDIAYKSDFVVEETLATDAAASCNLLVYLKIHLDRLKNLSSLN
jgi:hypothetical protein